MAALQSLLPTESAGAGWEGSRAERSMLKYMDEGFPRGMVPPGNPSSMYFSVERLARELPSPLRLVRWAADSGALPWRRLGPGTPVSL